MSFLSVTVDTTVDFEIASTSKVNQKRNLLLAPPSIATHEEKLRDLFTTFDRSATDLQMLDRLSAGFVTLSPASYDLVLVLSDTNGARRTEVSRDVYTAVVPSMKVGAKLQFQDGFLRPTEAREATLAGLVETDGVFVKLVDQEAIVPLRLGAKKKTGVQNGVGTNHYDLGERDDGDELIDEDGLLSEDDLKRPFQPPLKCQPESSKKRRRPCKDCTCGLATQLEAEDQARRAKAAEDLNTLKLKSEDLNDELDFTVKGKTGSCNSCSLGDAFRCSSCPYIGLPPFNPGEEVKILNDMIQL